MWILLGISPASEFLLTTSHSVTPLKMEPTQVTETSEVKTQTPGKFPEESTLESQHGESLKTYSSIVHRG
jgi:hypothetical protein